MLELEQYQITGSTARGIAAGAEAGIREGSLAPGAPLPTVRALAERLGTSPATVSAAYRILRERGLVRTDGRRGTRVSPRPAVRPAQAVERPRRRESALRDLSIGLPDPALLPPLRPALDAVDLERSSRVDGLEFAVPELLAHAREWYRADGVDPAAIAVVSGAADGIERVLASRLRPGDRVLVEDPAYPPIRDIVLALGLIEVPVAVDERGLRPDALAGGLRREADALLVVPRAQNPVGAALDLERAAELGAILSAHPSLLVVEDDHASEVAGAPYVGLVAGRERWVVIRSASKVLHPDLRLAVIAGDAETIGRVEGRQALGPRWVSHLLQSTAAAMLADPGFPAACARAAEAYAARRAGLVAALADHGIAARGATGLNVWVSVREEAPVVRALAEDGWAVLAGERFRLAAPPGIRITATTLMAGESEAIAASIARVEHAGRARRVY